MRAGVKELILPKLNEKDLKDLPEFVRNGVKFRLVETMDEVLQIALTAPPAQPPAREEVATVTSADTSVEPTGPSASAEGDDQAPLAH